MLTMNLVTLLRPHWYSVFPLCTETMTTLQLFTETEPFYIENSVAYRSLRKSVYDSTGSTIADGIAADESIEM